MGDQKQRNRTGEWPTAAQTAADFPEKLSPSTASRILHANRVANHCPRGGSKPDIDTLGLATIYKIIVAETPVADERVATARARLSRRSVRPHAPWREAGGEERLSGAHWPRSQQQRSREREAKSYSKRENNFLIF